MNTLVKAPLSKNKLLMTGTAALLRGVIQHRRMDTRRGFDTESFISGYRGSPLGNFDTELWNSEKLLKENRVFFQPGLNEDLAATSCWGTQQVPLLPNAKCEGVAAFWYGKGPGVDRSLDAIKHGNLAGTSPKGGVVLFAGDDHGAKSSSTAHQSEHAFISAGIPVFNPSSIQEYVTMIPVAVELSRFAGVWVGFKCLTEIVESSGIISSDIEFSNALIYPKDIEAPEQGLHIRMGFAPKDQESSLHEYRLPAVKKFVAANGLNRTIETGSKTNLGIVAPGKSYVDLMEAFRLLGLGQHERSELGIGIFKPMVTWPLDQDSILEFCKGYEEILVIEEKRDVVEDQIASYLYRIPSSDRPVLTGKQAPGTPKLVSSYGELTPSDVAQAVELRLQALGLRVDANSAEFFEASLPSLVDANPEQIPPTPTLRIPMYCSGCPHSRATRMPDDSLAFGGIGCHGMAMWIPELHTLPSTHMGGEGANWLGAYRFSDTPHIFQNMGDGTYQHSGLLAIRAAIASEANITYKILYNAVVAMTGGQPIEGEPEAHDIANQLLAEGCKKVVLVSEDPARHEGHLYRGIELVHRDVLPTVQEQIKAIKGITAIVYDQGCAADRRRLRKKGMYPEPDERVFINPEVCEGCGDCNAKSSCVSVLPMETELGRKRTIDQDSCNKDFTCIQGFCPSFVIVKGANIKNSLDQSLLDRVSAKLTPPAIHNHKGIYNILLAGIGGTGVISLGSMIAKAALLEDKSVWTFDVTGVSQKNGPVCSHVRLVNSVDADINTIRPRIPDGQLDLLVGCDVVASVGGDVLSLLNAPRTRAVVNEVLTPTAAFQRHPEFDLSLKPYEDVLNSLMVKDHIHFIGSSDAVNPVLGSGALMNIFVLGYAFQQGLIPLKTESLETVIGKRGNDNLLAFRLGRLAFLLPDDISIIIGGHNTPTPLSEQPIGNIIARSKEILTAYQNANYALRYEDFVQQVRAKDPQGEFSRSVAFNLFRLMRYKDEYEVARLHTSTTFKSQLNEQFAGDYKVSYSLAPPLLPLGKTPLGEPRKIRLGPWMHLAFKALAPFKFLRGTPFDPFGYLKDRKIERELIIQYRDRIEELLPKINDQNYGTAVEIAQIPSMIKGYGHVKERNLEAANERYEQLLPQFNKLRKTIPVVQQA